MATKKMVFTPVSVLLVFTLTLSMSGPIGVIFAAASKLAKTTALLQFKSGGHVLGFASQTMYAATGSHALRVNFLGARTTQPQASSGPVSGQEGAITPLSRVAYPGLWDGIDLVYAATPGSIYTTTYTLAPGADVSQIRLGYNVPVALNKDGTLRLAFETGTLTESAPIAWQDIDGKRLAVDVAFHVQGREVGFALGAYNPHHPLIIDPSLEWHTFLGGTGSDDGNAIVIDGSGNLFVSGISGAAWGSPVRAYTSNFDIFVARLDPSTGSLVWNTFLGGTGSDLGNSIAIDTTGSNLYATGSSTATWGSPVRAYSSGTDAFAAKLDAATGSLTWNTFLGSAASDVGNSIAVDGSGNVFVTGVGTATWGTPVRAYTASGNDAFAAKLNSSGTLLWNTFLGTSGTDGGNGIAVDGSGGVFVAGRSSAAWSCSPTACTVRAYSSSFDGFIAKLNASTGALTWNSFLGASGSDDAKAIVLDGSGNIYITGYSGSTWGSPVRAYTTSSFDAFVAKFNSSGSLTWNTFLGGTAQDLGHSVTLDGSGNLYVAGNSNGTWGSPIRAYSASDDGFAAKLDSTGGLVWNTFIGGINIDEGSSIVVDGDQNVYVAGFSSGAWGSPVRAYTASNDAYVAKIGPAVVTSSALVQASPTDRISVQFTVTFSESVTGVDTADFSLTTTGLVAGASISGVSGSGTTYTVTVNTGSGNGTIRLNLIDNDTIVDAFTTAPLGGTGAGNGSFMTGETYSISKMLKFSSLAAQDGWILESTETSGVGGTLNVTDTILNIGDDLANKQFRGILSFDTSSISDTAVITDVALKIRAHSITGGGSPMTIFNGFMIDLKTGFFGTTALQITDFQQAADKTYGPLSPALTGGWYNINLTPGKGYINKLSTNSGLTQIRLRFNLDDNNNAIANYLSLFTGDSVVANQPQLVIKYYIP